MSLGDVDPVRYFWCLGVLDDSKASDESNFSTVGEKSGSKASKVAMDLEVGLDRGDCDNEGTSEPAESEELEDIVVMF